MMQFVQVNDDVVSVELSVDTLYTIGNALDVLADQKMDEAGPSVREAALASGFKNAHFKFKGDESSPEENSETE